MLLGEKQLSELKEKIREKSGRVSFTEMMAAFSLIMKEQDTKNKCPCFDALEIQG